VRLLLLFEDRVGRVVPSFVRGSDSEAGESGDLEVLPEADGAERLPERRVSRGERGGPIAGDWTINWWRGMNWERGRSCLAGLWWI